MIQQRICILTLGAGAGQLRAAEAVQRALYYANDTIEVRVVDALGSARSWCHWLYTNPHGWLVGNLGRLWRSVFGSGDGARRHFSAPSWLFRQGWREVLRQMKTYNPHLVVVTDVAAAEIAALGRREDWCHVPILAVQTDYESEPFWVQAEIDAFCVASERARAQLISSGVSPSRVLLCGVPVDPAFALSFDKEEVKQALGLDLKRPVILAMGRGTGPMPLDTVVSSLELCNAPMQVLAVAGHDRVLLDRLELLRGRLAMDLRLFGWTENIPELMAVSDLLIAKPGGLTTAEALTAGLPMVLTRPIPGPEEGHVRYLSQKGVALYAPTLADIPRLASRLLSSPDELHELQRRSREWSRPDAAHAVAQVATALLEKATNIDLLATPPPRPGESAYLM